MQTQKEALDKRQKANGVSIQLSDVDCVYLPEASRSPGCGWIAYLLSQW